MRRKGQILKVKKFPLNKSFITKKRAEETILNIMDSEDDYPFMDRYNKIHNYRRQGDKVFLYYNDEEAELFIFAGLIGDNISKDPFLAKKDIEITDEVFEKGLATETWGVVEINEVSLSRLKKLKIINQELSEVIYFNRFNPGFFI